MITVHHLNNSRSQRVLWLLEELGLDYEVKPYQRDPETMLAPPSLAKVHPLGKSPVLEDDGVVVAESGAIIEYLIETYGGGRFKPAPGTPEARRYTYWLHYAEGSLMPLLLMKLVFDRLSNAPAPFFIKPILRAAAGKVKSTFIMPQLERNIDFMEAELGAHEWFAGPDFTAADIQMSFPVEASAARGGLGESRPHLMTYLERIRSRPAYKRAEERGGPFDILRAD